MCIMNADYIIVYRFVRFHEMKDIDGISYIHHKILGYREVNSTELSYIWYINTPI